MPQLSQRLLGDCPDTGPRPARGRRAAGARSSSQTGRAPTLRSARSRWRSDDGAVARAGAGPRRRARSRSAWRPSTPIRSCFAPRSTRSAPRPTSDWICVISDDCSRPDRFAEIEQVVAGDDRASSLSRSPRRLGFYRNFERALGAGPAATPSSSRSPTRTTAGTRRSCEALRGGARPARSSSTATSGSSTARARVIARDLLDRAAQQPHQPALAADRQHDHRCRLADSPRAARPRAAVPRRPGRAVPRPLARRWSRWRSARSPTSTGRSTTTSSTAAPRSATPTPTPASSRGELREPARRGCGGWRDSLAAGAPTTSRLPAGSQVAGRILLARCGRRLRAAASGGALRRFVCDRALAAGLRLARCCGRGRAAARARRDARRRERCSLRGIALAARAGAADARADERPTGRLDDDASLPRRSPGGWPRPRRSPRPPHLERRRSRRSSSRSPTRAPERVNLLIPTIDLKHLFGGYIAKFNLARKLAEAGLRVRIVAVDPTPPLPRDWREQVESYSGLDGALRRGRGRVRPRRRRAARGQPATTASSRRPGGPRTSPATRSRRPSGDRFLYLIQEYEPFTFVMGSWAAVAEEHLRRSPTSPSSRPSCCATSSPRADTASSPAGARPGTRDSVSFQNAITAVEPPTAEELAAREARRLLFYARAEPHAARNMFELGLIALSRRRSSEGVFGPEWELSGSARSRAAAGSRWPRGASSSCCRARRQGSYGDAAPRARRRAVADVHAASEPGADRDGVGGDARRHQQLRDQDGRRRCGRSPRT